MIKVYIIPLKCNKNSIFFVLILYGLGLYNPILNPELFE